MNSEKMREKIHAGIDEHCAFLTSDPYRVQRVLHAANNQGRKEKQYMKRKMSLAMILLVCLMLVSAVALAAALMNFHIEKAMDIVKDSGAFSEWTLEDKLALIEAMQAENITLPEDGLHTLADASASAEEKNRAATEMLTAIYGSAEHISHFTIASHDWGDPSLWTLEQKAWFWETLREKGLYDGKIKYLLPGDGDLTREQAAQLAKQAIQDAYMLSDEAMAAYDADVTFFTINGTEQEPRWRVYLGHADAEAADYSVLLTRDGQVTEDASLYIFRPGYELEAGADEASTVEKPFERYLRETGTAYLSADGEYHLLADCPAAGSNELQASHDITAALNEHQPCRYCVMSTQLWSAADKLRYGAMIGSVPTDDMLSEAEAERIACEYLLSRGKSGMEALVPYLRYISFDEPPRYEVYYARLENGLINPVYTVVIDAADGTILNTFESSGNGLG